MKKLFFSSVLGFITFFIMATVTSATSIPHSDIAGEHIEFYITNINIQKDGKIRVTESIDYDFYQEKKRGIIRKINHIKTNRDGKQFLLDIKVDSVKDEKGNDYKYVVTKENNATSIKIGEENVFISGRKKYMITYMVSGAITYFSDHDELYWNVTGNESPVTIAFTQTFVNLPQQVEASQLKAACYTGYERSQEQNCSANVQGTGQSSMFVYNTISGQYLPPGAGITVAASFPKNLVAVVEPKEYVTFFDTLGGKIVLLLIILGGLIWYIIFPLWLPIKWFIHGRDPKATTGVTSSWFDSPMSPDGKSLTPVETGALLDEVVDMKDISGMIVNLAQRGYYRIEERKKGDFYFIKLKETIKGDTLQNFEQEFITALFKDGEELRLKDADLVTEIESIRKHIYKKLVEYKFFPKNPDDVRKLYLILVGIGAFTFNFPLILSASIFGRIMPRKTIEGINASNVAKSLRNFLRSQERQLEFQAKNQIMFEKLLPFAIAFGVERQWAERFKDIDLKSPGWYQGYGDYSTMNTASFVNSLNAGFTSFSTAATPTSSSSGFSSGFSGGSSGGGGGGGGTSSW